MTTLITDGFEDEPKDPTLVYNHNILYGETGWTDEIEDATIDLLVKVGAIRLHKTVMGVSFETRIYVSTNGKEPR